MKNKIITFIPSLFFQYAKCPTWIWHDIFSDEKCKGELSELNKKLLEQGVIHEQEYVKDLTFTSVLEIDPIKAFNKTLELMRSGLDLIYQGCIQYEEEGIIYRGRPDFLKKVPGKSKFGNYYYIPEDIKSSTEISTEQEYQLILYGIILEKIQNFFPEHATIINRNKMPITLDITENEIEKTKNQINKIVPILKGNKPPIKLTSSCKDSPWYSMCVSEAEEKNDIALLYNLDMRSHPALRELGINTIDNAANIDVDSLPKIPHTSVESLKRMKIQAQSLRDNEIKWLSKPKFSNVPIKIFFDIEGDPIQIKVQYLFGFWISGDLEFKYAKIGNVRKYPEEGKYFLYFIAEKPEDEELMWNQFLKWIELLPTDRYVVYHYATYEKTYTHKLEEKYGTSISFSEFYSKLVDLEKIRKETVIFPLYFYSIKDIAKSKFLNFKWRHAKAGGAQSIFWYEQWLEEQDRSILNDIIDYNEDDVRATEYFYDWLIKESNKKNK